MAKGEGGFQFFGRDWRADVELRACSLAARGLWAELLMVMDGASPRGVLLVNGAVPTLAQVAQLAGCSPAEAKRCLAELVAMGAASRRTDGAIYSRRMAREAERSATARANVGRRYNPSTGSGQAGGDTSGGTGVLTDGGTEVATDGATGRVTKPATNRATKPATETLSPLHPPFPSESFSESSSVVPTAVENRLRARGGAGGKGLAEQAFSALAAGGFAVEGRGSEGLRIEPESMKKSDPQTAYRRLKKHLVSREGKTDFEAEMILLAAYSPEMAEHEQALALCLRLSRQHKFGWYPERQLVDEVRPKDARQGERA